MKKKTFTIPIYDYEVTLIEIECKDDKEQVVEVMKSFDCNIEDIREHERYIDNEYMNGGDTFRNMEKKRFLVVLSPCENEETRREIINHEKRHVEDRLLEWIGIHDIEASAYLAGYLSKFMY